MYRDFSQTSFEPISGYREQINLIFSFFSFKSFHRADKILNFISPPMRCWRCYTGVERCLYLLRILTLIPPALFLILLLPIIHGAHGQGLCQRERERERPLCRDVQNDNSENRSGLISMRVNVQKWQF